MLKSPKHRVAGVDLELRDTEGFPLWRRQGGGRAASTAAIRVAIRGYGWGI